MGDLSRRIKGVLAKQLARIRDNIRAIVGPLTRRERFVYGGLILGFMAMFIAPRVIADIGDEGSVFSVSSTVCSSTEAWLSPENMAGQHSVLGYNDRASIDVNNSASWSGEIGSFECSGFSPLENHNRINNAISISLKASNIVEGQPTAAAEQTNITLQDGQILNERIEERLELIEPNLLGDTNIEASFDGLLMLSISDDSGETWSPLHRFNQGLSSETRSKFDIAIPDSFVKRPSKLAFKVDSIIESETLSVLVDGITWSYEVARSNEINSKLLDRKSKKTNTADLPVLNEEEDLFFELAIKNPNDGFWQGVRSQATGVVGEDVGPDISVKAKLLDKDGIEIKNTDVILDFQGTDLSNENKWEVSVPDLMPSSLNPGEYTVELEVDDGSGTLQTISQDFLWGVLALNTNKSSYQQNDTAAIQMTVLDEIGATICDAELSLAITGPGVSRTLSTSDNTITINDTCIVYGNQITPDYEAAFAFRENGSYQLKLTAVTDNGTYSITELIDVIDDPQFEISREGPTRIYPILDFPMKITVYSRDGFSGKIHETVPSSFEISQIGDALAYGSNVIAGPDQTLTWEVDIPAGESVTVGYQFDAPDISPEFYVAGPLELETGEQTIFTEQRSWQLAGDAVGRMIMFYDGATAPTGWTCISCTSGDDFYQRFVKGAATYGTTGGGATHTHTASTSIVASTASSTEANIGTNISDVAHTHTGSTTLTPPSNLPSYRQLKLIRRDTTGEPTTLPAGVIGIFDTGTMPTGWTQYSAQDGSYIRGENTAGTTGGSNSHTVAISGTANAASATNERKARGGGVQTTGATAGHTHSYSGNSASSSNEPPYIEVVLGKKDAAGAMPTGLITMWDDEAPASWDSRSGTSEPLNGRFIKPATSYGTTGGSLTHSHTDTALTTGTPASSAARTGTSGASATHTHTVNITGYSTVNHEPPYREAFFAKYNPVTKYEQAAFRFFEADNSTDVGAAIAAQDTAITSPAQGTEFRLRMLLDVSVVNLAANGQNFKLQYATRSGTCDTSFTGETFSDVGTVSGAIRYFNNTTPGDGVALTGNANDPTFGGSTIVDQTYEEANNFTNSQAAINVGEAGLWDFSLVDISAAAETSYCFRVVKSDGSLLDTYTVVPQITTPPPPPKMIMLYDGVTVPSGWTCISCTSGDDVYQRMIRGESTYGNTGGNANHSHTASGSVAATGTTALSENRAGSTVSAPTHTHTYTPTISSESNLPAYRQLQVIQYDSGTPSTIPNGAIGLFTTTTMPANFTRYSAQDGNFVYGENTIGTTGGSNTHTHTISGSTSAAAGATTFGPRTNGTTQPLATNTHDHTISSSTGSVDKQPPHIEMVLGQATSDGSIPGGIITMWTDNPGGTWTCVSCMSGDDLYQRFFKPTNGYGTTGGGATHSHTDVTGITSGGANQTINGRTGTSGDDAAHTHSVDVTGFSTDNHLPPYIDVIFYQSPTNNTAPNAPTALDQQKTNTTSIGVGNWTNETSVLFEASVSDPDNPDTIQLCVEVKQIGTAFTNTEDACGTGVSYTGTALNANVTISSLTDGLTYHWQARTKDALGVYSSWVSFGANAESATDFRIDSTAPTGTVYDGTSVGVDIDYNDGSLDSVDANWNINSAASGLSGYEYSLGTVPAATDVIGWTSNGTTASVTGASATLQTSQIYYFNVRATDNAGNQAVISSDGFIVTPTLSFASSPGTIALGSLNPGNSYTSTTVTTLSTSTNAYNGYTIRAYAGGLLTNGSDTIGFFDGGTYASPDGWQSGDTGFGYTSNDNTIQGSNIFNPATCAGGNPSPCYAPFSLTAPGDIVADHTTVISGTSVVNEEFDITQRVTVDASQEPGTYTTIVVYNITARY